MSNITPVDDIANDDKKLEEKAEQLVRSSKVSYDISVLTCVR